VVNRAVLFAAPQSFHDPIAGVDGRICGARFGSPDTPVFGLAGMGGQNRPKGSPFKKTFQRLRGHKRSVPVAEKRPSSMVYRRQQAMRFEANCLGGSWPPPSLEGGGGI